MTSHWTDIQLLPSDNRLLLTMKEGLQGLRNNLHRECRGIYVKWRHFPVDVYVMNFYTVFLDTLMYDSVSNGRVRMCLMWGKI